MMKSIVVAAALGAASLSFAGVAHAGDFPATPLQHGAPTDLPGEKLIPGMGLAMGAVNAATQPILQPMLAPTAAAAPASAPMAKKHMMMHRHHMMHKKMMMKKAM